MRVKLDENISRHLAIELTALGNNVDTVGDEGLLSRPDSDVAAAASRDGRMLFTLDLDFSDIRRFPPGTHPGIVLFRPASFGPMEVNRFILAFARQTDLTQFQGCLVVVDSKRVRIRRPDSTA